MRDDSHPDLGREVDANRVLEFAVTETDRSFAPRQLLAGRPPSRELRLPLYSGDRFVAFLDLASSEPIGDECKGELRALLGSLTASLHAARNWAIAVRDELSGLASRRYFETRLAEEWARHERYGSEIAVACFDLDDFKKLNDSFGHAAGDAAIRSFGELARAAIRSTDVACRYGGEEFAILFPGDGVEECLPELETLRRGVEETKFTVRRRLQRRRKPAKANGAAKGRPQIAVTVSIGAAESNGRQDAPELVVQAADRALYRAKDAGRNRVES